MTKVRERGEAVRRYIVAHVDKHPTAIAKMTADKFDITRQAVNKHLQKLVSENALTQEGNTRNRSYKLASLVRWMKHYDLVEGLEEDRVWRDDVALSLGQLPQNALDIWHHGFTEMLNNAIDHSEGTVISVVFEKTAASTRISIHDDGVGIFRKIQTALKLMDERHAVLELAKGKLTTDPARHTGEGIFFSSRMFDYFETLSGGVYFSHQFDRNQDWISERDKSMNGTSVFMELNNHTARTTRKVFDKFTSGEGFGDFTKTVVPVRLARYGEENLVSRSQAKRLLARVDRFQTVIFDFHDVESIGHAFADEIFRVFATQHPKMMLTEMNANSAVKRMINRVRGGADQMG